MANETQGVAGVCQGGCPGVGKRGVKVVEVHDRMVRKGGVHSGSLPKPSHRGSILANETQGVPDLCLGDVVGGYTEVEGPRGGKSAAREDGMDSLVGVGHCFAWQGYSSL